MERVVKPWGWEELLEVNDRYVVKRLFLRRWERCSWQFHVVKRETVFVLEGCLSVVLGEERVVRCLAVGEFLTVEPGVCHRMEAHLGDVVYLEAGSPGDVVRLDCAGVIGS